MRLSFRRLRCLCLFMARFRLRRTLSARHSTITPCCGARRPPAAGAEGCCRSAAASGLRLTGCCCCCCGVQAAAIGQGKAAGDSGRVEAESGVQGSRFGSGRRQRTNQAAKQQPRGNLTCCCGPGSL
ncbi:hypothetical protein ABPG75_002082 [Micractinium tetrahymenae]